MKRRKFWSILPDLPIFILVKVLLKNDEFERTKSRALVPLECEICGSTFERAKNLVQRALKGNRSGLRVCSESCRVELTRRTLGHPVQNVKLFCTNCGKEFERTGVYHRKQEKKGKRPFCSKRCAAAGSYTRPRREVNKITLKCVGCGKSFERCSGKHKQNVKHGKPEFCSKSCVGKHHLQILHTLPSKSRSKLEENLERRLTAEFPNLVFSFNDRTTVGRELDISIPSLKLAFELNGPFHYHPYNGVERLERIQKYDVEKANTCLRKNIELNVIRTDVKHTPVFEETCLNFIRSKINGAVASTCS